jgi:hypothetical protein
LGGGGKEEGWLKAKAVIEVGAGGGGGEKGWTEHAREAGFIERRRSSPWFTNSNYIIIIVIVIIYKGVGRQEWELTGCRVAIRKR